MYVQHQLVYSADSIGGVVVVNNHTHNFSVVVVRTQPFFPHNNNQPHRTHTQKIHEKNL